MPNKKARFDFYEIVTVNSTDPKKEHLNGLEGAIMGMAQNEATGRWGYAVHIYGLLEGWDLYEDELSPTGRSDCRESFYDGSSIQIRVDPATGEGQIVDRPDE